MINIFVCIGFLVYRFRLIKIEKKYKSLTRDIEGDSLENIMARYYDKIDDINTQMGKLDEKVEKSEEKLLQCIQKLGFIRYNAFNDIGGELSFSIALLDGENNGFILSSIHNRNSNSMVYSKPIKKGRSFYTLSAEELQALDRAKNNSLDEYMTMLS